MQQQNKLEQITSTVPSSQIAAPTQAVYNPIELCAMLEQTLPNTLFKYYNIGLNYYKNSDSDVAFIKNLISLFSLYINSSLKEGDVNAEQQEAFQKVLELVTGNIEHNLKYLDHTISATNFKKNIFDARKLSLIILGYVITYIKKTN